MPETKGKLRVSAVQYLNTKPIVYGLEKNRVSHRFELSYDIPSICSKKLLDQEADLALIPSIEYSRIRRTRSLNIVPDVAVVSHDEVNSVELFFNKNLSDMKRIAVDSSSRTSVALLEIILKEKYDIEPVLVPMNPDLSHMLKEADAALVIGDIALEQSGVMDNKLDLGEEWNDLTDGLPFVYSFWAGTQGALTHNDVKSLIDSRNTGVHNLSDIAGEYVNQNSSGRSPEFYVDYLTDNIQFKLGNDELNGLKEFYSYCYFFGMIEEIPELYFFEGA
ncbi:menaquinone biosynthesis protein [bacterium]|nr:MAG: menaquinone biosynthesis protein [bacterium]